MIKKSAAKPEVTIHLQDQRWKKPLSPYCKTITRAVEAAGASGEVSVVLADDSFIHDLSRTYRGKDKPTNILSFINEDEPLGDLILAFDTIERESDEQGKSFKDHTVHLIVHGVLHLRGYDHEMAQDAITMEGKEIEILEKLGISNPYL